MSDTPGHPRFRPGPDAKPIPYDPTGSESLPLPQPGSVILMLAADTDRAWTAEAAISLCGHWAADGGRVVLADLHLDSPILHQRLGEENLEGVVDIFLYGASIARSARPAAGRGFYLIPAGTYESDPEVVYRHPRWAKLVAGFQDARATLALFAPADIVDLEALAPWVSGAILLGRSVPPGLTEELSGAGMELVGWLTPAGAEMAGGEPETTAKREMPIEPAAAAVATSAEPSASPSEAPAPATDERTLEAGEPDLDLPPPPVRRRGRMARSTRIGLGVLAAVLVLLATGLALVRMRPGLLGGDLAGRASGALSMPTSSSPPGRVGAVLPYSVQVIAFQSYRAAVEHVASERARFPEVPFFISPELIDGTLYFRILAGALPDTSAASALRRRLVETGAVNRADVVGEWDLVKRTPLSFDLGEFDTPAAAVAFGDTLAAREIPSYVLVAPYTDGSRRWQLFGGAYQDSASADAMRQRLERVGAPARLIARIGSPAPSQR